MGQTTTVTAIKHFPHEGRTVQPGEVLDVPPIEAASLKYRGVARLGGNKVVEPESVIDSGPNDEPVTTPRPRRRYRRRDMANATERADITADE